MNTTLAGRPQYAPTPLQVSGAGTREAPRPDICSFVAQQVSSHLPDMMKTVTSSVLPLLVTRDTAQVTPLLFAKAKMFGVITGMYVLPTAGLNELRGKATYIRWMSD